jgi:hypothetical protein
MTDTSPITPVAGTTPARRRRGWRHWCLWLVIFSSGAIVGGGSTLLVIRDRVVYHIRHPEEMPDILARQLQRSLGLDESQTARIEQIFRNRQKALQALRRDVQPKIEQELDRTEQEVGEVLSAEQRAQWQARFRRLRDRWLPRLP